MKIICINKKIFKKSLGYGLWSLLTIGLLIFTLDANSAVTSTQESSFKGIVDEFRCMGGTNDWFFGNVMICTDKISGYDFGFGYSDYYDEGIRFYYKFYFGLSLLLINCGMIGIWVYSKQQKVKFSWCEKGSQNYPNGSTK